MNIKIVKILGKTLALISIVAFMNTGIIAAAPVSAHHNSFISDVVASSSVDCSAANGQTKSGNSQTNCNDCDNVSAGNCSIINDLVVVINFLAAGVGIVVVTMIVIGGIEYTTSADNPQSVANARKKIINALIGLVSFIFLYAFLNFIIPGGVF